MSETKLPKDGRMSAPSMSNKNNTIQISRSNSNNGLANSASIFNGPQTEPLQPTNLSLGEISSARSDQSDMFGAPPSPSTLTDIILSVHASLYGAKRQIGEIKEMVRRYYDSNAVFDSPLVSAHGRDRIIDQFVLAFALPALDVRSELRDVICSDFEFDGTRAGIIDHTITVTFFPNIFGSTLPSASDSITPGTATTNGNTTPHPFLHYPVSASGDAQSTHVGRRRNSFSYMSSLRTPSTSVSQNRIAVPVSMNSSRKHTTSHISESGKSPRSFGLGPSAMERSVLNGDPFYEGQSSTQLASSPVPASPTDGLNSHWNAAEGLGRRTVWSYLLDMFLPLHLLRKMFSIEISLFSRLEFNEAGRIVRHEDTWSVRELVVGMLPFLSLCTYLTHGLHQSTIFNDSFLVFLCHGGFIFAKRH